ncbi:hypothetical protein CP500_023055 [Tychonema bourrellyi FEM_GT703]|uniref:Uncharacterized protein n=1 Tax=Tychonema bourrellyi FEM_GT703 TaxID=2040638 RepID=A0A2G4EUI0_9CYAN|nr:hypothetical protein [Tychonema bourrellyi]PHX53148.1 hypothetical protein CP500_023055 [Tychonema bourrellyi FEM_GT703]
MTNQGVLNRRQFLMSLCIPAIAKFPTKSESPLPGVCQPEFWFGELVDFCWIDEISGQSHSERGQVIGVVWNPTEKEWEYRITWLSSTAYPGDDYPICDDNLVSAEVLCKL